MPGASFPGTFKDYPGGFMVLVKDFDPGSLPGSQGLILTDYRKWGPIQDEFDAWCIENNARREGMVVYYDSPEFVVMMRLKWG